MFTQKVRNFLGIGRWNCPTLPLQVFDGFNHGFGHSLVGLIGTAHQGEAFTLGNALMVVGIIQPKAEKVILILSFTRHRE